MKSSRASLRRRFPILLACTVAALSCAMAFGGAAGAAPRKKVSRPEKVSLLYVLNAGRANLLPV